MAATLRALAFALIVAGVVMLVLSLAPRCREGERGLMVGNVLMAGCRLGRSYGPPFSLVAALAGPLSGRRASTSCGLEGL